MRQRRGVGVAGLAQRAGTTRAAVVAVVVALVALVPAASLAEELVYADGRRETCVGLRQDEKGRWTAAIGDRRTTIRPGEIVAVINEDGKETEIVPELVEGPAREQTLAALASVRDAKDESWRVAAERLSTPPTRAAHDELVRMTTSDSKDARQRGIAALALLRTKESVVAAAEAVLKEKDATVRRAAASSLFAAWEVFRRAPTQDLVKLGLADKDAAVRFDFAMLSPLDCADAVPVLKADGLKNGDHHVRESAAMELGRRGDASGEAILVSMLQRPRIPGVDDPEMAEKMTVQEKVQVCGILGRLRTAAAKAALKKASASGPEAVRKAAAAALAAAESAK
jgi:HEAT repeat protein